MSLARVCLPAPGARRAASTSGSTRSFAGCLVCAAARQASSPDQAAGGASPSNSSAIGSVRPTLSSSIASLPEKSSNSKLPRSLRR